MSALFYSLFCSLGTLKTSFCECLFLVRSFASLGTVKIAAIDTTNDHEAPLASLFAFSGPENVELPAGIWKVKVVIEDKWGSSAEYIIPDEVIVRIFKDLLIFFEVIFRDFR